ncbi:MAG: tyrosine-type recombinase/integrase [Planctomycetota bacterium]
MSDRETPPELLAYVEHQRLRNLSPRTVNARARVVARFAAWLGARSLAEARPRDLRRFFAGRREVLSNGSQSTEVSYLKSFYAALVELGTIERDPTARIKSWRPPPTRRPLGLLQVRALLLEALRAPGSPAIAARDRAVFEVLFATGARRSEVCAALAVDVDLDGASVLIRRAKAGTSRRLPLPPPAVDALRAYFDVARSALLGDRPDPGALFLVQGGGPLTPGALSALVERTGARAGVDVFPHLFRRTLATELGRAGCSLHVVQKVLGHAHLSVTSDYVSVALHDMRSALESFAQALPRRHSARSAAARLQCRLFSESQPSAA